MFEHLELFRDYCLGYIIFKQFSEDELTIEHHTITNKQEYQISNKDFNIKNIKAMLCSRDKDSYLLAIELIKPYKNECITRYK